VLQKLKDINLYLAGSRKAKFFLVCGLLAILFLIFKPESKPLRFKKQQPTGQAQTAAISRSEVTNDLSKVFEKTFGDLKTEVEKNKSQLDELRKSSEQSEQKTAEILKKMLEKMNENQIAGVRSSDSTSPNPVLLSDQDSGGSDIEMAGLRSDPMEMEAISGDAPIDAPPAPPEPKKVAFVGAGDSVRIKLLAGVNAPTDGTPYPVVFKLVGDIFGPDGSTLPLGEARLIAAAQGSLTDQRALFRLTQLNLSLPSGERKVFNVDGWVVGEDGIRGMSGILIDPIGKAIAGGAMAGAIEGAGQGLSRANSSTLRDITNYIGADGTRERLGTFDTVVNGDLGEYVAGRALMGAGREWGSIIRDRLKEMVPAVQVYSGREATAVFAKSFTIEGLFEALDADHETSSLD